ncbi:MerR family transcriptional regulator [Microlunatus endophyticus]|uniref:MerR family transcriptional regulator n=1 Tax=Microlunatus endophyticus TaxID=1716077 RepID=A0A917W1T2_9ACTN|nr:MerR family transcriptional regulator [Microlunatus endophyticus]GGL52584.1 MerR family transcriptional regulator [Microlunatus endophyticus]
MAANSTLRSIGQVLASLKSEFPDISISKIRFLESVGLLAPERAPSGYRRYRPSDVERLRYILRVQKTQYLPLKVIRDHLEQLDRGLDPSVRRDGGAPEAVQAPLVAPPAVSAVPNGPRSATTKGQGPTGPQATSAGVPPAALRDASPATAPPGADRARQPPRQLRLSRADLLEASGLTEAALTELESIQVIVPRRGTQYYGREALAIAVAARRLAVYGIDSRHLRAFKLAADREIGLVEQAIAPHTRARVKDGQGDVAAEVTQLVIGVHAALIRTGMER